MPFGLQRFADRADAAVHHVAGRNDVRARSGLIERLANQHVDRRVVDDIARLVEQAVLSVCRIRVERHVGEQADLRHGVLDGADRRAHQIVRIERLGAVVAALVSGRVREQGKARDAGGDSLFRARHGEIDRPARDAGQRSDRLLDARSRGHEQGPDEIGGAQAMLGMKRAAPGCGAGAAEAKGGIIGVRHGGGIGPCTRAFNRPQPYLRFPAFAEPG